MTPEKVAEVLSGYEGLLIDYPPVRLAPETEKPSIPEQLGHARWMCGEAQALAAAGRMEKAFRWLGFVQGVFFSLGLLTIRDLKSDNRPAEEVLS